MLPTTCCVPRISCFTSPTSHGAARERPDEALMHALLDAFPDRLAKLALVRKTAHCWSVAAASESTPAHAFAANPCSSRLISTTSAARLARIGIRSRSRLAVRKYSESP